MVYKFFDWKVSGSGAKLITENEQLANELRKPIIRKFEKRKVFSTFINQLLENLKKEKYIQHLKIIFGVLI